MACGPYSPLMSRPFVFHFYQEEDKPTIFDIQKKENISLWQELTSKSIPIDHIDSAIYGSSFEELSGALSSKRSENIFLNWIITHKRDDIKAFLLLAKELEELRFNRISKWYYPTNRWEKYDSRSEAEKFSSIIQRCRANSNGLLSDRYGLQYIRALFTVGRYKDCITFYDNRITQLPDNNLFKRMIKGYVAGSLRRLGQTNKANRMYAEIGDINSIADNHMSYFKTLAGNNPESEVVKSRLNHWIDYEFHDDNLPLLSIADAALNSQNIINRGDWLYLKAYIEEIYNGNHTKAIYYLRQSLKSTFSKDNMRTDAETMLLCLRAKQSYICKDLRHYLQTFQTECTPFYYYIIPALLKKGRVSEAILLTNYASRLEGIHGYDYSRPCFQQVDETSHTHQTRDNTYANTGFQLMLSRSAQEIISYKKYLKSTQSIVKECINQIRHDDDYLNEIIGTLFLREGNYPKAEEYLSRVSEEYQENLNIKKDGYLYGNPWMDCYLPADKWEYPSSQENKLKKDNYFLSKFNPANDALLKSDKNAKLNFAHEMSRLVKIISTGNPDERGMARIRYAIARYNSFERCWALTQYWLGYAYQCNYQPFYISYGGITKLDYLKDLPDEFPGKKWLDKEIQRGIHELQSPEAIAEAYFLTGNYRLIAQKYPSTSAGKYLSKHCDSWYDWI